MAFVAFLLADGSAVAAGGSASAAALAAVGGSMSSYFGCLRDSFKQTVSEGCSTLTSTGSVFVFGLGTIVAAAGFFFFFQIIYVALVNGMLIVQGL